jgi:NAD(P)H-nitrite reductase large subunit
MWGGVTTPAELCVIADAADKYDVPMVKVTGGQRIDLLGVRKADLFAMWANLNAAGTDAEAMEIIAAFVQLCRENSRYLHRICKWVAKIGLARCQDQMADLATRRAGDENRRRMRGGARAGAGAFHQDGRLLAALFVGPEALALARGHLERGGQVPICPMRGRPCAPV